MPAGAPATKSSVAPPLPTPGNSNISIASASGSGSGGTESSSPPPASPSKTVTAAFLSNLFISPFASIWGGASPGGAGATGGGGAAAGASRGKTRAAIPFGLGPPPSPSPDPKLAPATAGKDVAAPTTSTTESTRAEAIEDAKAVNPIIYTTLPDDSPARAVLSKEQLQDLTASVADSQSFLPPPSNESGNGPRTPARASSILRNAGTRSASASNASSAHPSSAYATLSRVRTRASAASLRASLRNVSGTSSQAGSIGHGSSLFAAGGGLGPASAGGEGRGGGGSAFLKGPTLGGPSSASTWQDALERAQKLDAYVGKAVFQAGVDYESRPMVVLASCGIPDPKEVDHDALFDRIMTTMELFVETDYTLIYFASGGKHAVRWSWIWKTYRRIGRKFRKNLKRLYIVHPTFFTKRFVDFISTGSYFVSPKFARKIVQVQTLSQLATHIPLTQIDIPPEVLQANRAHEPAVILPAKPGDTSIDSDYDQQHQMFGVSLEVLMGVHGEKGGIPRVVRDCVEALRTPIPSATTGDPIFPLDTEGLFRRSPPSALLKTVQESYDRGHPVNLTLHYQDPNIAAALLKVFFRSLPVSIFPSSLYSIIRTCPSPSSSSTDDNGAQDTVHYIRNVLLAALEPPSAVPLLSYVFELLNEVARRSATNRMDAANLATVFAPNLVGSGNIARDMAMCRVEGLGQMTAMMPMAKPINMNGTETNGSGGHKASDTTLGTIIKVCIERYHEIFDQVDAEIRPVYGSELSAHLDALGVDVESDRGRRPSVIDHLEDGEVNDARLQHQMRRTQAGAGGRLASVSESSMVESMDEEDGSPTRGIRAASSASLMMTNPASSHSPVSQSVPLPLSPSNRTTKSGKSITGIGGDGFRSPFGAASIGRNSSGSLRLTRDRLRSGSGPVTMGGSEGPQGSPAAAATVGGGGGGGGGSLLTGTASAVAVSGASVSGLFASPARSMSTSTIGLEDDPLLEEEEEEEEDGDEVEGGGSGPAELMAGADMGAGAKMAAADPSSPTQARLALSRTNNAETLGGEHTNRRKRAHRRGLSEVLEDMEQA
ncbi:hypothetical protein CF319_g3949 [Tilletia indica]|nr:hypothetical protein CF319_g3949 [Tilletia indica]